MFQQQRKPFTFEPLQNPFEQAPQVAIDQGRGYGGVQVDAPKKRGGMFAGATLDLNGALAGFAAGMGNPAGAAALQALHQRRMEAQRQSADEDSYQRQREDRYNDWVRQQTWELQNKPQSGPQPYRWESNDGSLMEMGADGKPRVAYKDPTPRVVFQPDGRGGYIPIDVSAFGKASSPASGSDDDWEYSEGGPTQPASGGFPR